MSLPRKSPTVFCKAYIARELTSYKDNEIWMSYWSVMGRLINRADQLKTAFCEVVNAFGYTDKPCATIEDSYLTMMMEHIWFSADYKRSDIEDIRANYSELNSLKEKISALSSELASALRQQEELYEASGFQREDYQSLIDTINLAGANNGLYNLYVAKNLKKQTLQYDLKYWPDRAEVVEAIGSFESKQKEPTHHEIPDSVLHGRASDYKGFIVAFDEKFGGHYGALSEFRFSHQALAEIMNVVLDLSEEQEIEADTIKVTRNRHAKRMTKEPGLSKA
jgi:hypothetical protein